MSLPLPDSPAVVELDDGALLEAIASGNLPAFEAFFDRHYRAACGLAFRLLRDDALVEDVLQDVFLAVWRRSASFHGSRGAPRAWFFSLVHHRAVDQLRRNRAGVVAVPLPEAPNGFPDPTAIQPLEHLTSALRRDRIQVALADLPAAQREALELAYFGGYPVKDN